MTYPDVLPHDPIQQIAEDLFVVYGSVKLMPFLRITRNMAVVRSGDELTLINPVRLDEAGLASLEALGAVKHVLRLGAFHGMDDPFYVDRYNAEFWSFEGGTTYTVPPITRVLSDNCRLPFPRARLFAFDHMKEPEGIILLQRTPNILLTCDSVQSYSTPPHMPHTGAFAKLLFPFIGFPKATLIGPLWMKFLVQDRGKAQEVFERILEQEFDQLLSAHGTFLTSGAHTDLTTAYNKMFG